VGRRVRDAKDKCVIAIFDNRMGTARYKGCIGRSFNYQTTATRDIDVVRKFIIDYIGEDEYNSIQGLNKPQKNLFDDNDDLPF
jgi:Rad3-related DNA helicase